MKQMNRWRWSDFISFFKFVKIHEFCNSMKQSFQSQWSFELTDRHMIDDKQWWEWEQTMMIIARIWSSKKWWEWCTINEDNATDENFNDDKVFENKNDNNEYDNEWIKFLKLNVMLL